MTKRLDEDTIVNELKGGSLFFQREQPSGNPTDKNYPFSPSTEGLKSVQASSLETSGSPHVSWSARPLTRRHSGSPARMSHASPPSSRPATKNSAPANSPSSETRLANHGLEEPAPMPASMNERGQSTTYASMHARKVDNVVDEIRKTVKEIGRIELYVRVTPDEKSQLADIVYTYKRQGVDTSENEVSRIAVNYLLADYRANGAASILAQVIEALLA